MTRLPTPPPANELHSAQTSRTFRPKRWKRCALLVGISAVTALISATTLWSIAVGGKPSHTAADTASRPTNSPRAATTASPSDPLTASNRGTQRTHGTIITETSSNWTLRTPTGNTFQITLDAQTQFGANTNPKSAASFIPGDNVIVAGPAIHGIIAAHRITRATRLRLQPTPP